MCQNEDDDHRPETHSLAIRLGHSDTCPVQLGPKEVVKHTAPLLTRQHAALEPYQALLGGSACARLALVLSVQGALVLPLPPTYGGGRGGRSDCPDARG